MSAPPINLPRSPTRLRLAPFEAELPGRLEHRWSTPLPGLGPRLALTSADGRALLVRRDGVALLGGDATDAPASWPRVALPVGHPGSAVAGAIPWVADDGRLFRWTPDGVVTELPLRAEAALALDERRVLVVPRGGGDEVALAGDGAEVWRGRGTLGGACIAGDLLVAGVPGEPHRLTAIDLATGRARWTAAPAPHRLAAVVAARDGLLWVACADRTLAAMRLDDGGVAHAHDTGVAIPTGAVDAGGVLHLCHELAWVTVRLAAGREVAERLRLTDVGRIVDPPLPVRGGRLLVRTVAGDVLLLGVAGPAPVWRGARPAWGVAAAEGRLYLLEGDDPPVLHCLAGSSTAR